MPNMNENLHNFFLTASLGVLLIGRSPLNDVNLDLMSVGLAEQLDRSLSI